MLVLGAYTNPGRIPVFSPLTLALQTQNSPAMAVKIKPKMWTDHVEYPIFLSDFDGSTGWEENTVRGFLIRLGLVRRQPERPESFRNQYAIANRDGIITRIFETDMIASEATFSSDGSRIIWTGPGGWYTCLLPDGEIVPLDLNDEIMANPDLIGMVISDDGSSAVVLSLLNYTPLSTETKLLVRRVDLTTMEIRTIYYSRVPPNVVWPVFTATVYWPNLLCDITPDGSEIIFISGIPDRTECGIFHWDEETDTLTLVRENQTRSQLLYNPAFDNSGSGIMFLRAATGDSDVRGVDLFYMDLTSGEESKIINTMVPDRLVDTETIFSWPPAMFFLDPEISTEQQICIIAGNLEYLESGDPGRLYPYYNLGTLQGAPPVFELKSSAPSLRMHSSLYLIGSMGIDDGEYSEKFIDLGSSEDAGRIFFDYPDVEIIGATGF